MVEGRGTDQGYGLLNAARCDGLARTSVNRNAIGKRTLVLADADSIYAEGERAAHEGQEKHTRQLPFATT